MEHRAATPGELVKEEQGDGALAVAMAAGDDKDPTSDVATGMFGGMKYQVHCQLLLAEEMELRSLAQFGSGNLEELLLRCGR